MSTDHAGKAIHVRDEPFHCTTWLVQQFKDATASELTLIPVWVYRFRNVFHEPCVQLYAAFQVATHERFIYHVTGPYQLTLSVSKLVQLLKFIALR